VEELSEETMDDAICHGKSGTPDAPGPSTTEGYRYVRMIMSIEGTYIAKRVPCKRVEWRTPASQSCRFMVPLWFQ
jgi:hypothetical protein